MTGSSYLESFNLADLNGANGFTINGLAVDNYNGWSLSSAGDVNGDGLSDVIIGAWNANPHGKTHAGQSYVVFGQRGSWNATLELSALNGTNGFTLNGINANDGSGYSVSSAGDMNGDGLSDLIIGAINASPNGKGNAGQCYVVFGQRGFWNATLELSTLNGANGFTLNGVNAGDQAGIVSAAGDVNGDSLTDVVIGAWRASVPGGPQISRGQVYLIFGQREVRNAILELSDLNGANGFTLNGINGAGTSVSSTDINGDGLSDLLIGASFANNAGQTYVVFGHQGSWSSRLELSALNGVNGFTLNGINPLDYSGYSVSTAGDINGDGLSDLIIGAFYATPNGKLHAGQSYVIFGQRGPWNATFELSALNGINGFTLNGVGLNEYDESGYSVALAGDINDDGLSDIIIGALAADFNEKANTGQSYVVFGHRGPWNATFELALLNGKNGFTLNGIKSNDESGYCVSTAGDINDDGLDDFLIGAPNAKNYAGQSYVIFGSQAFSLTFNPLIIQQGQLITFNSSLITINPMIDTIQFSISKLQHGQFELLSQPSFPITQFSAKQLKNGEVVFAHDGTSLPPSYLIAANHGLQNIAPQMAPVVFSVSSTPVASYPAVIELSSLNGVNGFTLNGIDVGGQSGLCVSSAGDVNGDGIVDILIAAPYASFNGKNKAGQSYLVFGHREPWPASLELSSLIGSNGVIFNGINTEDYAGARLSTAGDVNGDALSDIIIGAYQASPHGKYQAGQSYLIFGKKTMWTSPVDLSSLNGTNGVMINGIVAGDQSGVSVNAAGDINGDGLADIGIGAWGANRNTGQGYVVFGHREPWPATLELSTLNGTNGFILNGVNAGDFSSMPAAPSVVGDVNGDGISDIITGAYQASPHGKIHAGQGYVVFGQRTPWSATLNLSALDGTNGFTLNGINADDISSGFSSAGDVNGDGLSDMIITAYQASPNGKNQAGQTYIMFGQRTPWNATLELSVLDGMNGFALNGINAGDLSGTWASSANDMNGDGLSDITMTAYSASPNGRTHAGQAYVVFGQKTWNATVELSTLNGINGFTLNGINASIDIESISAAGDVNGDGLPDIIIGAIDSNSNEKTQPGQSYVVFGDYLFIQLSSNKLILAQNETITLNATYLSARSFTFDRRNVLFSVSDVQFGRFELSTNSRVAITNFTQSQIDAGLVRFVQDGSVNAPTYSVVAQTGIGLAIPSAPQTANINFSLLPSTSVATQSSTSMTLSALSSSSATVSSSSITPQTSQSSSTSSITSSQSLFFSSASPAANISNASIVANNTNSPSTIPLLTTPTSPTLVDTSAGGSSGGISSAIIAAVAGGGAVMVGLIAYSLFRYKQKQQHRIALQDNSLNSFEFKNPVHPQHAMLAPDLLTESTADNESWPGIYTTQNSTQAWPGFYETAFNQNKNGSPDIEQQKSKNAWSATDYDIDHADNAKPTVPWNRNLYVV